MAGLIIAFGIVALIAGLFAYAVLAGTIVLTLMWGWFVTPVFGIPVPPMPLVAGLIAVAAYLTKSAPTRYKDHPEETYIVMAQALLSPWIALLFAWFIHLWAGMSFGIWGS